MPTYFHAINKEFSYILTPIGAPAQLYVKAEIDEKGKFSIAGGKAGMKVSWYVYADRNDRFVQQHPDAIVVEPMKHPNQMGKYLMPDLFNQPKEKGIFYTGDYKPQPPLPQAAPTPAPADNNKNKH
jgi:hypothetical protein